MSNKDNKKKEKRKSRGYWDDFNNIYSAASECIYMAEFNEKYPVAYRKAKNKGWLDSLNWLIKGNRGFIETAKYWELKENVEKEAKKYKTRSEFSRYSSRAYHISIQNKWLDEWFPLYGYNTKNKTDYIYIYKFRTLKTIYVGRTVRPKMRDREHRNPKINDTVYKFSTQNQIEIPKMEIIENNLTIYQGREREGYWIEYYKKEGWIILNKKKAGGLGSLESGKWTYEACKKAASECISRNDFSKKFYSAYSFCVRNRKEWLDEFFPNKDISVKKIDQLDLEGNFIKTFNSLHEAGVELNFPSESKIGDCCRGKRKTAAGYKWRYHL